MTPNLQIEYCPIDALLPFARNPHTHLAAQITKLAASIVKFGWIQPILVDAEDRIIAGYVKFLRLTDVFISKKWLKYLD
jgi:hypothetical protein